MSVLFYNKTMNENKMKKYSKLLSYILRHRPEELDLILDKQGWVDIDLLLNGLQQKGYFLSHEQLASIVANNDKKRFTISDDGLKIRAAQGHSMQQVTIEYQPQSPPLVLYHGTATRFLASIKVQGLLAKSRQYVHLSADRETAQRVAVRHGVPVILTINTYKMQQLGYSFYLAENGVWLVEKVPVDCIEFK